MELTWRENSKQEKRAKVNALKVEKVRLGN